MHRQILVIDSSSVGRIPRAGGSASREQAGMTYSGTTTVNAIAARVIAFILTGFIVSRSTLTYLDFVRIAVPLRRLRAVDHRSGMRFLAPRPLGLYRPGPITWGPKVETQTGV